MVSVLLEVDLELLEMALILLAMIVGVLPHPAQVSMPLIANSRVLATAQYQIKGFEQK